MYRYLFKRIIDIIGSSIILFIFSPILVIILIILFFSNNGDPLFFQLRPGLNEKVFKIIKFKTMNDNKDLEGNLLPDNQRMTKVGRFIRKTSLDELPQMINVLKGEMSLIGPRPLLVQYLPLYNDFQKKRHLIRPGITGWAQVNGRNAISWQQKFVYDIWYVDNLSLWLDIKIVFLSIKKVFTKEGINVSDSQTMEIFLGNNEN
ncbi:MAG: sugar transferase [Bacteroidota bacterium]